MPLFDSSAPELDRLGAGWGVTKAGIIHGLRV